MNATDQRSGTYEEMVDALVVLIAPLRDLHRQKAVAHTTVVQTLLHSRSRDEKQIEQALDHLLDCACVPEGLALFKTLCRHYWHINPQATAEYVSAYREMWDNDSDQEQEAVS
jgi:hypothetical protein